MSQSTESPAPGSGFRSFTPPARTLMGPGPSDVHARVLAAMARPTIGHLDPAFVTMMEEVKELLRYAFQTANEVTFPVSGPGSVGMETCFVNLVEPGDAVVVCRNGVFGGRMLENVDALRRRADRGRRRVGRAGVPRQGRGRPARPPRTRASSPLSRPRPRPGRTQTPPRSSRSPTSTTASPSSTRSRPWAACRSEWTTGRSTRSTRARRSASPARQVSPRSASASAPWRG